MELIKFHYPPNVAVAFIDATVEEVKKDPEANPKQKAIFEDVQTMLRLALEHLEPVKATAPGGTGLKHKS